MNICVPGSGGVGASSGGRGLCPLCCLLHQEMCARQTSVCFVKWTKHKWVSNKQCVLHQWTPVPENWFVADHCEPGAASHKRQPSFHWGWVLWLRVGTHFWHWAWEPLTQRMCPMGAFASCTWGGASEKGGCCDLCLREEETQLIQPCLPSGLCGTAWSGLPSSSRPVAWRWAWISHLGALLAGMCGRTVCAGYAKLAVCLRCFSLGHPYAVKLFTKHLWWNMPEKPVFCKCRWPEDSCYSWVRT